MLIFKCPNFKIRMNQTILLNKNGDISSVSINSQLNLDDFTDKSAFISLGTSDPVKISEWTIFDSTMVMYGFDQGEAGMENKHDLPPPVDSDLYFGDILVVFVDDGGVIQDLTAVTYQDFYQKQLGGFEDLTESGSEGNQSEPDNSDVDSEYKPDSSNHAESSDHGSDDLSESDEERETSESDYSDLIESEDEDQLAEQLFSDLELEKAQEDDGFVQ